MAGFCVETPPEMQPLVPRRDSISADHRPRVRLTTAGVEPNGVDVRRFGTLVHGGREAGVQRVHSEPGVNALAIDLEYAGFDDSRAAESDHGILVGRDQLKAAFRIGRITGVETTPHVEDPPIDGSADPRRPGGCNAVEMALIDLDDFGLEATLDPIAHSIQDLREGFLEHPPGGFEAVEGLVDLEVPGSEKLGMLGGRDRVHIGVHDQRTAGSGRVENLVDQRAAAGRDRRLVATMDLHGRRSIRKNLEHGGGDQFSPLHGTPRGRGEMILEPPGREPAEQGPIGFTTRHDLDVSEVGHPYRVSSKGMTTSLPKPAPVVFLVVPVSSGPIDVEKQLEGKVRPLAGLPCSGLASMAATIATGAWPESHGVVTRVQPHPDRLGYEVVRPDRAIGSTVWSRAVDSGRHVGLCNWPHDSMKIGCDGEGRLDWIDPEAVLGLSGEVEGILPPASFAPEGMRSSLLASSGGTEMDAVFAGLDVLADRGPDLLLGWLPEVAADPGPRIERMEQLRRRLGDAASMDATLIVLELPSAGDSIFQQVRGGSAPRLLVIGRRTPSISGRPRLDRICDLLCDMLECGDAEPRAAAAARVGGPGRLDTAGIPAQSRLSSFDLKQFEQTRSREIGASLSARGRHADAEPWLVAAVENQHGMIDAPVVGLLFASFVRRQKDDAARRLLTSVEDRFPRPIIEVLLALLDGGSDGLQSPDHLAPLVELGPFVMQSLVLEFVRRGVLSRSVIRAR